jgi:hypothetical protein
MTGSTLLDGLVSNSLRFLTMTASANSGIE